LKAEVIQFWDEKPWLKFRPRIENYVSTIYLHVLETVLSVSKKIYSRYEWDIPMAYHGNTLLAVTEKTSGPGGSASH